MKTFTLALDWRPNTNHTGFFIAKELGYFKEHNLEVTIVSTEDDNYAVTPAKKVELGLADFALCPMESIVSYRTKKKPFDALAIATIFQEDISAIATLKSSGIKSPKDLDGKKYASYEARYEDKIVQQMIKNDGGKGTIEISYPNKLGIWNTLLTNEATSTWIFTNWEGVEANNKGVALDLFTMKDYGIPYGYSPVVMVSERKMKEDLANYKAFAKAMKKGFQYAIENPEEAAKILAAYISESDAAINLLESQQISAKYYGEATTWGFMNPEKVQEFLNWLQENGLEKTDLQASELISNILLTD